MKRPVLLLTCVLLLTQFVICQRVPPALAWHPWSDKVFSQAKQEHRFIFLDLEAVWCHWCHVMDRTTYRDPKVKRLLQSKFLLVRADQDSRPDLSNRYEDYGWPATVVFDSAGHEIVKRQGYLPPNEMASMLQAIIDDPTPGPSVKAEMPIHFSTIPEFSDGLEARVLKAFNNQYDAENGGWGFGHKYLDADSVEFAMYRARNDDAQTAEKARHTLSLERQLIDPVWGGAYQYSAGPDWRDPHFEKIISVQADTMRLYAPAYAQWHDPHDLKAAENIHSYLKAFLESPEGAFYVSQDADLIEGVHSAKYFKLDDTARRKLGIPRIDKHVYSRENGWAIQSLCALYAATGDISYLHEAETAAQWIISNRGLPGGGFRHGGHDVLGPYLGDSAAMAQALVSLYSVSGNREWLSLAHRAVDFVAATFSSPGSAGFLTSKTPTNDAYTPHPQRDENVLVARTANLLFHYTGEEHMRAVAKSAMRYLATPKIAMQFPAAGALLAQAEFTRDPLHITVIGAKNDPAALALFKTAIALPESYKRVEWWDRREGSLPNNNVQYPELKTAAAFLCTDRLCSSPLLTPEKLSAYLQRISMTAHK